MRRFERLAEINGVTIVDDYAHHPAEIAATLKTAKEMSFKRVWAVHQPFTYSRTAMLLDEFAKALSIADRVVLTEIMGSREKNTYNIYSKDLAAKIDGCVSVHRHGGGRTVRCGERPARRHGDNAGLRRHLQGSRQDN